MDRHSFSFAALLLDWYRQNARDLPWRHTQDPYHIWVSEIMLQQTRVAAVIGYYTRFLKAFPTVQALADASEEELLSLWQGLGYYSRARNLQRAAKQIAARGGFPETYEALRALPGIGPYTAGAIASAAFGVRVPAVDGNVSRVVSRLTDNHGDITAPSVRREIEAEVAARFPESAEEARIFNQAFMELGATVCVPNGPPRCERCPVSAQCLARERGTAEALPVRAAKRARRAEERTVLVLLRDGRAALRKRPGRGLLAGLWEFPNTDGVLTETEVTARLRSWGLSPVDWYRKLSAVHVFTHIEWHMTGYVLSVAGTENVPLTWLDASELRRYAVPSAFTRFRAAALEQLPEVSNE
ncbi:MAG: A/G-specific adenine glycosylase [Oscillibacter sp.]|nr:A/G-specific adenine glycosylase [Oscillibacter sp.]